MNSVLSPAKRLLHGQYLHAVCRSRMLRCCLCRTTVAATLPRHR